MEVNDNLLHCPL